MTNAEIRYTQRRCGADDDGYWGPVSTAAAKAHLVKIARANGALDRFPSQWSVAAEVSSYGRHGEPDGYSPPSKKITLPFAVYYEGRPVTALYPHPHCADAFLAAYQRVADMYPTDEERRATGILAYDGLYNPRPMRGVGRGGPWSMHSWRIAVDHDAARNGNRSHWPLRSKTPLGVMECFAAEGITSAGAFWSRDAMHHQATAIPA